MGKKLLVVVILLILVATTFAYHDSAQAVTWVRYTAYDPNQTSYWWGGTVQTMVDYANNNTRSVTLQDVYAVYDLTAGTNSVNSSKERIYDGYGGWANNQCHSISVSPGEVKSDYFWINQTVSKDPYGRVDVLNGAAMTGNCGYYFGGWVVRFHANGAITKYWTE